MDAAESLVSELGWIFFSAWGMLIAVVSFVTFRADLVELVSRRNARGSRSAT